MAKVKGSVALIESLIHQGVDTIFGYPGGCIMPTYDALYDYQDKIRHVLVRHEQGASHAAEGYARLAKKLGVCLVTSGPGATNLVTGIADALMDSIPLVCITGQVNKWALGTDAFQETDVIGVTIPITKWSYQITSAEEIPWVVHKAFAVAVSGRPGPVLIDITKNAQTEECDLDLKNLKVSIPLEETWPESSIEKLNKDQLQKAADLLNSATQPFLLVGHGVLITTGIC
jgi:acetolactate synthase I/II/III large subunit